MTNSKHEWRKKEKQFYLPKTKPEIIDIPTFNFVTIEGEGNPNSESFAKLISALYSISYGIKMTLKKEETAPEGYCDYTVYPLEGVYDINDEAKKNFTGKINKDDLVYKIMIRQPDFVDKDYFDKIVEMKKQKNEDVPINAVRFEQITEGPCIQMLHIGSFDDEPASFEKMEAFAKAENRIRSSKIHREIYLNDFRKVTPDKLKTVLRFNIN